MSVGFVLTDIMHFIIFGVALIFLVMVALFRLSWKRKKAQLEQIEEAWRLRNAEWNHDTIRNEQAKKLG